MSDHLYAHAGAAPPRPREPVNPERAAICEREVARLGLEIDWLLDRRRTAEARKLIEDSKMLLEQARRDCGL